MDWNFFKKTLKKKSKLFFKKRMTVFQIFTFLQLKKHINDVNFQIKTKLFLKIYSLKKKKLPLKYECYRKT